jgi:23S rRNA pseudouridine2605 synthase
VTDDATPPTRLRLQKILADAGVASRRAAERLITAGRVSVNGAMITTLGATADPASDEVCLDGKALTRRSGHIYVALNKPLGYVTTASDERGRPTALDLVRDVPARLFPVGRLDRDSEGLLLLTTDGALTEWLTHPRHEIEKEYMALVDQEPSPDALAALATGITLDGRLTAPAGVRRLDRTPTGVWLRLTLHEGRKRQVRRMCAAVGLQVRRLLRVRVGPVLLGDLRAGVHRPLTAAELQALRQMAGLAATS